MSNQAFVYISAKHGEPATVSYYDPAGKWQPESDHNTDEQAAKRVHYLNGGSDNARAEYPNILRALEELVSVLDYAHDSVHPRGEVGRFLFGRENEIFEHRTISTARKMLERARGEA